MEVPKGKKIERILRVLLNEPDGNISKYRVAKNAETSFAWVHEYLSKLEALGHLKDTKVNNLQALFEIWKTKRNNIKKKNFVINDPMALLSEVDLEYALTTYQGENLVQGYLFPSRFDVYIRQKDFEMWDSNLLERGLMGLGNFRILIDDEHVFYKSKTVNEFTVVSTPQLIVDLYNEGGVCGEAADNLVRQMVQNSV